MRRALWVWLCLAALGSACGGRHEIPAAEAGLALGRFEEGLQAPDPRLRLETVLAMELTGSQELKPRLQGALADPEVAVQAGAALALLRRGDDDVKPRLVGMLTGQDPALRRAVARALISPQTPAPLRAEFVILGLRSADPEVVERALRYGGDSAASARDLTAELLRLLGSGSPQVAASALRVLVARGRSDLLEEALARAKGGELKERRRALQILIELPSPEAAPLFAALAEGPPGGLREDGLLGVTALGALASPEALREVLKGADEETTLRALRAASRHPAEEIPRLLRSYREDSRLAVRLEVYRGLARHPRAQASDFRRGLTDEDPQVGAEAMEGLLRAAPEEAGGLLAELLQTGQGPLAARALVSALEALRRDGEEAALERLRAHLAQMAPLLRALLTHAEPEVRGAAAEVLFEGPSPVALYQALDAPAQEVTYALLRRLAARPDEAPLAHEDWLVAILRDPEALLGLRVMAAAALWRAYLADAAG